MSASNQLESIWRSDFGTEYTKRKMANQDEEQKRRLAFWKALPKRVPEARSFLEIGCNAGMNTNALITGSPDLKVIGIEPNDYAFEMARKSSEGKYQVLHNSVYDMPDDIHADLVFTCTVMIHISSTNLKSFMEKVYRASNRYILAMEYYWPVEKEISYRGLSEALWKRDYGKLWMKEYGLNLLETGYLDDRDGFDRTTWWLLEKPFKGGVS